jgi:ParB/RepB/Spo0J family partition protein
MTETRNIERIEPNETKGSFFQRDESHDSEALEDLAQSLASEQEDPITVRETDDDQFEVIDGDRRVAAVEQYGDEYGIDTLEAEVRDLSELEAARTLVTREEFRKELSPIDVAELVEMVYEEKGTQSDTADWFNKSQPWVGKKLRLLDHDDFVQEAVDDGDLSENAATAVSQVEDKAQREEVVERARDGGLNEDEVKDAIEQVQQEDTRATQVAENLNTIESKRDSYETHKERADRFSEVDDHIEEVEEELKALEEDLPENVADRYEAYQSLIDERERLNETLQQLQDFRDELEAEAEDRALTDDEQDLLTSLQRKVSDLRDEIGDPTVNVTETGSGDLQISIHVTVDPEDVPSLVQEYLDKYDEYEEAIEEIEPLEEDRQKAAQAEKDAQNLPNQPKRFMALVDDPSSVDDDVRKTIKAYSDETVSDMEARLEDVGEEIEETDEDHLEDLMDELEEGRDEAEELLKQKKELEQQKESLRDARGNASRAANAIERAKEKAREAFQALDDDAQEEKLEEWESVYDFSLDFLHGEQEVEVEEQGGGWYTVRQGEDQIKVQGSETADEVAEAWESDGFEEAEAIAA